jgi:aminoglycoside 3-N-acetyltransferase
LAAERACAAALAADLRALGVLPGATLVVHSSFKSLGAVPGGIETVIQGLLLAIGKDGTLLMPALSATLRTPAIFDVLATPARVGAIPEFFRTRPGTLRSLHPTHSVCAVGQQARALLAEHLLACTPPRSSGRCWPGCVCSRSVS